MRRIIIGWVALVALALAGLASIAGPVAAQTYRQIDVSKTEGLALEGETVQVSAPAAYGWPDGKSLAAYQCAGLAPSLCDTDTTVGFSTNDDGSFLVDFAVVPTISPDAGELDCTTGGCLIVVVDGVTSIANYGYVALSFGDEPPLPPPPPDEEPDFGDEFADTTVPPPGPCQALEGADLAEKSEAARGSETHKLVGVKFDSNGCEDTFSVRYSRTGDNEPGFRVRYLGTPSADAPAQLEFRTERATDPVFGGNVSATIPGLTYVESVQEQSPGDGSLVAVFSVRAGVPFKITEKGAANYVELTLELGPVVTAETPAAGAKKCPIVGIDTAAKANTPSPGATKPAALRSVDTTRRGCADRITLRYQATGGAPSYRVEYVAASRPTPDAVPIISGPLASLVASSGVPIAVNEAAFLRITTSPATAQNVPTGSKLPTGRLRFARSITKSADADGTVEALIEVDAARPFRVLPRTVKNGFELAIEIGTESASVGAIPELSLSALTQQASDAGFTIEVPDVANLTSLIGGPLASLAAGKISRVTITGDHDASVFGAPDDVTLTLSTASNIEKGKITGSLFGLTCTVTAAGRAATVDDALGALQWCASRPYTGAKPDVASAWVASVLPQVTAQGGFSRVIGKGWLTVTAVTSGTDVVGYQLKLTGVG